MSFALDHVAASLRSDLGIGAGGRRKAAMQRWIIRCRRVLIVPFIPAGYWNGRNVHLWSQRHNDTEEDQLIGIAVIAVGGRLCGQRCGPQR